MKEKAYRGWAMAMVAFASFALTFGPSSATLPVFSGAVAADLGWPVGSRTLHSTNTTGAVAAATLLLAGPMIVRFGLRRVMVAGFVITAAGMTAFLAAGSRPTYYAAGVLQGVGLATIIVGSNVLISRWFQRNQGLALGIALSGMSAGGAVFPLVAGPLIETLGWRGGMASLSLFVWLVALPLYLCTASEEPRPEEVEADAWRSRSDPRDVHGAGAAGKAGHGVAALIGRPGFFRTAAAMLLVAAADMAMVQHTPLVLAAEAGIDGILAALVLSVMFAFTVVGKLAAGPFFDRLSVTGMCFWHVLVAVSVALTFFAGGLPALLVFAAIRGVAHGGLLPKPAVLARHCYPAHLFDVGMPLLLGIWMAGAGVGPVVLAAIVDATGSYRYGLALLIAMCMLSALLLRGVRPAQREADLRASSAAAGTSFPAARLGPQRPRGAPS